ncbi:type II toxin-antitoxin system RelE/ParE family toxin [Reichenbachiella ulvae]|uniref:Type II toxin-antitoxin system RelE/ParE family toxin n=1 Tax=Reichenbachiella ulvae TaxID=2980104 RepID=A0ABT3CNB5_9BACT|nr:type II toxin-antitoxin system RelE/ParE family toxin [Reichenbachiella ulvae]MCV9385218.1 type II toxin-antitoxin system RelE/ParE family toxin [Reichenbachiella ulvae]
MGIHKRELVRRQADKYYQGLIDGFSKISEKPQLGKSYEDLRLGYRALPVMSHIVFYRVSQDQSVTIIRILHKRMDYKSRLLE